jgi:hypothetical protein
MWVVASFGQDSGRAAGKVDPGIGASVKLVTLHHLSRTRQKTRSPIYHAGGL